MPALAVSAAPYPVLRRAAVATGLVFAVSGMASASWVSRLPEIRHHLHASTGSLGTALLGAAIGSILGGPITGRMAHRFGSRNVLAVTCAITGLGMTGVAFAPSVPVLGVILIAFGFGYGSWDVAMNIHGQGVEAAAGKAWMPRYHAAWSVGGFSGAGIGAGMSALGVPVRVHLVCAAIICFAAVLGLLTMFLADRHVPEPHHEARPAGKKVSLFTKHFLALGAVMAAATLVEGAAGDWLGIYFDDHRGVGPAAGAAAFTAFSVAMATSRAAGTWLIEFRGRAFAVFMSGIVALAGVSLLLLSPFLIGAYAGAVLWGLGAATAFPAVISAAGETPGRSAEAISLVTPIGYTGFLVGPPVIGFLGQLMGLEHALWLVGGLAVVIIALSGATREVAPQKQEKQASLTR
ncbi:MAG TPA: MFS transporter [Mycobacteriales bacterium]|nr:MFS transporter [Mycobacteriales bacterium]